MKNDNDIDNSEQACLLRASILLSRIKQETDIDGVQSAGGYMVVKYGLSQQESAESEYYRIAITCIAVVVDLLMAEQAKQKSENN